MRNKAATRTTGQAELRRHLFQHTALVEQMRVPFSHKERNNLLQNSLNGPVDECGKMRTSLLWLISACVGEATYDKLAAFSSLKNKNISAEMVRKALPIMVFTAF